MDWVRFLEDRRYYGGIISSTKFLFLWVGFSVPFKRAYSLQCQDLREPWTEQLHCSMCACQFLRSVISKDAQYLPPHGVQRKSESVGWEWSWGYGCSRIRVWVWFILLTRVVSRCAIKASMHSFFMDNAFITQHIFYSFQTDANK